MFKSKYRILFILYKVNCLFLQKTNNSKYVLKISHLKTTYVRENTHKI